MRPLRTLWGFLALWVAVHATLGGQAVARDEAADRKPDAVSDELAMTPAIACRTIDGYEDYEVLPDAAQTSDEKLQVYFRPLHYKIEREGTSYRIHLNQDFQIRKRGQKAILQRKDKFFEYKIKQERPPGPVYLQNSISLKGLKPGEYDLVLILHDVLAGEPAATQTLPFRVIAAVPPQPEEPADGAKKKTRRSSR